MRRPLNTPWKFGKTICPSPITPVSLYATSTDRQHRCTSLLLVIDLCSLLLSGVVRMLADWWPSNDWRKSLAVSRFGGFLATIISQLERRAVPEKAESGFPWTCNMCRKHVGARPGRAALPTTNERSAAV